MNHKRLKNDRRKRFNLAVLVTFQRNVEKYRNVKLTEAITELYLVSYYFQDERKNYDSDYDSNYDQYQVLAMVTKLSVKNVYNRNATIIFSNLKEANMDYIIIRQYVNFE